MKHRLFKYLLITVFVLIGVLSLSKSVSASEGYVEMRSTTNGDFRCYASSIQMMSLNYKILVTCRNLLYPSGDDIFNYTLWATPKKNGKPIKFGALGFGRAEFTSPQSFTELYVTTEKGQVKEPAGPIVMRGTVKDIAFLSEASSNTDDSNAPGTEKSPTLTEEKKTDVSPTPSVSTKDRIFAGLKRAAFVSFLALAALIGLIFVLTKSK